MQTYDRGSSLSLTLLAGTWRNTDTKANGIATVQLEPHDNLLHVRVLKNGHPEPIDWGEVVADAVFAEDRCSQDGIAFTALFGGERQVQGNINQGLLVIASFDNCFAREFFVRADQ